MSVFFCNSCDQLIDSDEMPEFIYYKSTDTWKCQACIERDDWGEHDNDDHTLEEQFENSYIEEGLE